MLHVHRARSTEPLVRELARLLSDRPLDPFAPDVVAVPTRGVERWLAQRLSHALGAGAGGDGVCANVVFPPPGRLVAEALAVVTAQRPEDDPWARGPLTWALLEVIEGCLDEPWCAALACHLRPAGDATPGRRFATAAKLARLYDGYAASRPRMIRDWARGDDTDGAGEPLAADLDWQAELWRRVRAALGVDSPAERLPAATRSLRDDPERVDLPERLSLFGPTRLAAAELEVLAALGAHRAVHLWVPHPSDALWRRVAEARPRGPVRRHRDPTAELVRNPPLAGLGRDARELQLQLDACAPDRVDVHHPADDPPDTLLGRLQRSLADDADPGAAAPSAGRPSKPRPLAPHDRSVQVHACHGPARQVEVLREVLVGLLADDPTLEPRDVIVLCPDIEDYAPLISATFGLADADGADGTEEAHPGHRLRVRLADRSLRQTNPLLGLLATLLELAGARVTASQVLDLAAQAPVRRRFGFGDDDLERLQDWVVTSGVRWGLDAEHRRRFHLQAVAQNTWRAGLDRLLLGAAMAEDGLRWVDRALPLDDVDSSDIDLAGRLAELVDRLTEVLDRLGADQPLTAWLDALTTALDLLADVPEADAWQSAQASRELARVRADAGERAGAVSLSLGDVQALLAGVLAGRPTRANFRTGNLTVCSMVPMRSVPHRVVCLLGLDDGRFPRSAAPDGDDVLSRDPLAGERDPRSEDRQLLLDAVLAAREHLVIVHTGADPRTNVEQPPAVPIGEVLDAVDALAVTAGGAPARAQVVVHHPLQPFDRRNFTAGALGRPGPFSFDRLALRGARRALRPRVEDTGFVTAPLPADVEAEVSLDDLIAFFEHPARGFLRQRLLVTLLSDEEPVSDAVCVEPDGLQRWAAGDRLLQARLAGADLEACRGAELRRGTLPPSSLGQQVLARLVADVEPLVAACAPLLAAPGRAVDTVVELEATRLTGTVPDVHGATVLRATYSRLAAKHRLRAWLQLLSLTAGHPDTPWTAVTVGRAGRGGRRSTLGPVEPETARARLAELVGLRAEGLRRPLPMATATSASYAEQRHRGSNHDNARAKAEQEWSGARFPERADDAHYRQVWGDDAELAALLADPPLGEEEGSRFAEVALLVWEPLLQAERSEAL